VRAADLESRIRAVCLAFPDATEKLSHGSPGFFVGRQFAMLWMGGHHEHDFAHLWCAAPEGAQSALVSSNPQRFFRPPYVGSRGWIGVRLDIELDLDELDMLFEDAYRHVATKRQLAQLDAERG
jgi:hypothetical protein